MAETEKPEVVKDGEPNQEEPTPQEEQESTGSEPVKTPRPDVQKNLKIALQKERQRRKDAETQLRRQIPVPEDEDEAVRRFVNVEATTLINNKLLTDPTFKDRIDLVKDEMINAGKTLEDADNAVIARLFREMTQGQTSETTENVPPNQIKPTATPEKEEEIAIAPEIQAELDQFDRAKKAFGN